VVVAVGAVAAAAEDDDDDVYDVGVAADAVDTSSSGSNEGPSSST